MILSEAWQGKRYAVYGLARSGLATVEALVRSGCEVACWDHKEEARKQASPFAKRVDFEAEGLAGYDSLVVSPGVPINTHPIAALARDVGVEIIGDVELFARARGGLPEHAVVGITGTNGKSTTTALIHHILKEAGVPTSMGGNIGIPILAQDPLPQGGVYVLELSSYQIDLTMSLDCEVAVLLNITPDHLDRYDGSMEKYAASKARLFEMQSDGGSAVVVGDDIPSQGIAATLGDARIPTAMGVWGGPNSVSICPSTEIKFVGQNVMTSNVLILGDDQYGDQSQWPALQGPHNASNVLAAAGAALALISNVGARISDADFANAFCTFPGLPHRTERVREKDGVLFINDSKATNAEAAAPALAAYDKVRWIVGGQAKTESLGETEKYLDHVVKAYAIGEAGPMFARLLAERNVAVEESGTLEAAVKAAAAEAQSGETVLLSPACASFDQFRDFEARGDAFRAAVEAL